MCVYESRLKSSYDEISAVVDFFLTNWIQAQQHRRKKKYCKGEYVEK